MQILFSPLWHVNLLLVILPDLQPRNVFLTDMGAIFRNVIIKKDSTAFSVGRQGSNFNKCWLANTDGLITLTSLLLMSSSTSPLAHSRIDKLSHLLFQQSLVQSLSPTAIVFNKLSLACLSLSLDRMHPGCVQGETTDFCPIIYSLMPGTWSTFVIAD